MNSTPHFNRRQWLQTFAGAPLLPLASSISGASLLLSACGGTSAALNGVSFTSMAAHTLSNAASMATTTVGSTMNLSFSDGTQQSYKLGYQPFFMTGAKGNTVFAVVQFEYATWAQDGVTGMYGKLPSPIAILSLDQDLSTGKLSLLKYHNVDTSSVNGLWITCGASLSPWGTHLSSEEYEPNAFTAVTDAQFKAFSKNLYGNETTANPYYYGHMPEVTVNADGTGSIKKHYNMGRISHELVQVMPDERTVLMGDDATNSGYFVFVADKERDLSAGTLYVAKVGAGFSVDPAAAAAAPLTWIKMGSATSDEIKAMANTLKATDIMSVLTTDPLDASYTKVNANGKTEWIKLVAGKEKAAAFLETHRYAALLGASMGFSKMEGTTVNVKDKIAYSALQNCIASMVAGNALNTAGNPDKIANPDNLKFSENMRTLFIGEDSGQHVNNFLWAYNVDTKALSRIMSIPAGGESTGLHAVDQLNGWTYIMSNFQHAGDWGGIHANVRTTLDPLIKANYKDKFGAAVGYLTGELSQMKLNK